MNVVNEDVCEQSTVDDIQMKIDDLICCFNETGTESNEARTPEMDQATEILKYLKCWRDEGQLLEPEDLSNDQISRLVHILNPLEAYITKDAEDPQHITCDVLNAAITRFLFMIRSKATNYDLKITEVEEGEINNGSDYFENRKQNLDWLLRIIAKAKSKLFGNKTLTYVLLRQRNNLLRRTKNVIKVLMYEKKLKLEEVDEVLGFVSPYRDIEDLKNKISNKMYDIMALDEYIALVRSEAKEFESHIEESRGFEFEQFLAVDSCLNQLIMILDGLKTDDDDESTSQKMKAIKYMQGLQTKMDGKSPFKLKMNVVNEDVCEQSTVDDIQMKIDDLICCFNETGTESNEARTLGKGYAIEILKYLKCWRDEGQLLEPENLSNYQISRLVHILDPLEGYTTKDAEDPQHITCYMLNAVITLFLVTIRIKVTDYHLEIAKVKEGEINDGLDYFEKRKQNLEWLMRIIAKAKSKLFDFGNKTLLYVLLRRRNNLLRSTKNLTKVLMYEKKLEPQEVDEGLGLVSLYENIEDLKMLDIMALDEYIALVRSEAKEFESQTEESRGFEFEEFLTVDSCMNKLIMILDGLKTDDDDESTSQKMEAIKYMQGLQTKLDQKRLS